MKKKKAKFKSYSIQNVMMVTCMQKRVNIKLNPERRDGHLHTEDVEDQKRVKIKSNSKQSTL